MFKLANASCLAVGLMIACGPKCGVADQAKIVDYKDGLFLVYRVTGMQEKLEFFELYRGRPTFDACGVTGTAPVAKELYERSEGLLKGLKVRGDHLSIVFTPNQFEATSPESTHLLP